MWYEQWKDERPVREGRIPWGDFIIYFLDRLFREENSRIHQPSYKGYEHEGVYPHFHSTIHVYAPTMVEDSTCKMKKFVMGISDLVVNECRYAMFIRIMDISRLMFYAKNIEKKTFKQAGRDFKKVRIEDGSSSKIKFEVKEKTKFKRRFSNEDPSNSPRVNMGTVYSLAP